MQRVVIMATNFQPDRYAYQAFALLREHGHEVLPVAPAIQELDGLAVYKSIRDVPGKIDTVTLYMNPHWLRKIWDEIIIRQPGRVIFNPGTEAAELAARLQAAGIPFLQACSLVLLRTGRFESV